MIWLTVAFVAGYLLAGFLNRRQYATLALRLHAMQTQIDQERAATRQAWAVVERVSAAPSKARNLDNDLLARQARSNGTSEERRP